jgi:squalene synthase HpnC
MPVDHYENFPVASFLLPKKLVPAVEAIYAFARSADDIADEGDTTDAERLAGLDAYVRELDTISKGRHPEDPIFIRLESVIREYRLPMTPFYDLLSAFRQDVGTKRYATFDLLKDYCRRSANPVGNLMLHLYEAADRQNIADSDAICTALQLINFWQDVGVDWQKARIYIPQQDLVRFGVREEDIGASVADAKWRALMAYQCTRARGLMMGGAPLALRLPGRIGLELRLVVQGGLRILERIEANEYDVFRRRPQLKLRDWLVIAWRAFRMRAS